MNQANRLMALSQAHNAGRVDRIRNTAFRYYANIRRAAGNFNYNSDASFERKYTRSQYMGLANG